MRARADVTAIREAYRMSEHEACGLAGSLCQAIETKPLGRGRTKC